MADIPGFYYDAEKKRYFKIGPGFKPPTNKPKTLSERSPITDKTIHIGRVLKASLLDHKIQKQIHTFLLQTESLEVKLPICRHERLFIAPNGRIALLQCPERGVQILPLNQMGTDNEHNNSRKFKPFHGVNDLWTGQGRPRLSCVAFSNNDENRTLCAVSVASWSDYRLAFHNVDDNGLASPVAVTVCAGRGNIRDMCFIDKTSLLYTNGHETHIINHIDQPFFIKTTKRNNKKHFRGKESVTIFGDRSTHHIVEGFNDGVIRMWDDRDPANISGQVNGPKHHRPHCLHVKSNYLLSSFYGEQSRLCLFDLRFQSKTLYQQDVLNDHYQELKFTVSENGRFVCFPNQFGTMRMFQYDNLNPAVDYKSESISKELENEYFIPTCQFVDNVLFYSTQSAIIKRGC